MNQASLQQILNIVKQHPKSIHLQFSDLVTICTHQTISMSQAKRFLEEQNSISHKDWRNIKQEQLVQLFKRCKEYVEQKRSSWSLQEAEEKRKYEMHKKQMKAMFNEYGLEESGQNLKILLSKIEASVKANQIINSNQSEGLTHEKQNKQNHQNDETINPHQHFISQNIKKLEHYSQIINLIIRYEIKMQEKDKQQQIMEANKSIRNEIINQIQNIAEKLQINENPSLKEKVEKLIEQFSKKNQTTLKKLNQIFIFYSSENYHSELTFEENRRNSELVDLRIFVKYYSQFKLSERKEQNFKLANLIKLFNEHSILLGKFINLKAFCKIHFRLVELSTIQIEKQYSNNQVILNDHSQLLKMYEKYLKYLEKISILNNQILKEELISEKINTLKIQFQRDVLNPIVIKNHHKYQQGRRSVASLSSHKNSYAHEKMYNPEEKYSESILANKKKGESKYFIQQIREEILGQNGFHENLNKDKKSNSQRELKHNSLFENKGTLNNKLKVSSELPKLLSMSEDKLANSGVYSSLKHLSPFLFKKEEEKITNLLKLKSKGSLEKEDQYLGMYFNNQDLLEHVHKQIKNKAIKDHHELQHKKCPKQSKYKYSFEPYMKF